jgi:hypothetical protein
MAKTLACNNSLQAATFCDTYVGNCLRWLPWIEQGHRMQPTKFVGWISLQLVHLCYTKRVIAFWG